MIGFPRSTAKWSGRHARFVCFRCRAQESHQANEKIVVELQESAIVAPSRTILGGSIAIRDAIVNQRTGRAEIAALVDRTLSPSCSLQNDTLQCEAAPPTQRFPTQANLTSALQIVESQLASQHDSVTLLFLRGNILRHMGRGVEARDVYKELLHLEPSHVEAMNSLGNLLIAAGEKTEARRVYSEAVAKHPGHGRSHVNFALLLMQCGEPEEAREHFEQALKIDLNDRQAHIGLSFVLVSLGSPDRASWHRRVAFQGHCVTPVPYRGEQPPITVLELVSAPDGNSRIDNFLSDQVFQKYLVTTEFYDSRTALPPHQLIVNAIGDADVATAALAGAQSLLAHSTAPVINPPAAVLATGRCDIARRLCCVPGVITPRTMTLSRELLAPSDARTTLTRHGFEFPLLLRTPGFHGGEHFLRLESFDDLPDALVKLPGRDLTVIQYLNARAPDGKTRKYRVMMIDGQLYPLHAAISSSWKIHYFNAEMADNPEHRAEDAKFLANMSDMLGPRAMAALEGIQKTLGLDYGGIDFALNEKGEVLLFEANAMMAVIPPSPDKRWDYRRPAVEQIYRTILKMLTDRFRAGWIEDWLRTP